MDEKLWEKNGERDGLNEKNRLSAIISAEKEGREKKTARATGSGGCSRAKTAKVKETQ